MLFFNPDSWILILLVGEACWRNYSVPHLRAGMGGWLLSACIMAHTTCVNMTQKRGSYKSKIRQRDWMRCPVGDGSLNSTWQQVITIKCVSQLHTLYIQQNFFKWAMPRTISSARYRIVANLVFSVYIYIMGVWLGFSKVG